MPVDLEFISDNVDRLLAKRKISELQRGELHLRIQKIKLDLKHQDQSTVTKKLEELLQYVTKQELPSALIELYCNNF
jgi:hypothetical protein